MAIVRSAVPLFLDKILGTHPPGAHLDYRPDIDGLRAVAVLLVVIFHAFPSVLPGGFVGVDVFFVISGYLIGGIIFKELKAGAFDFKDFFIRRIRRIFPALIVVLSAVYVFGWFALLSEEYKSLGKHMAGGAGFIANLLLWREAGEYFAVAAETKPLLHLWSLGVEEQFYILWPVLLVFAWKRKFNLLTLLLGLISLSFLSGLWQVQNNGVAAFYSPLHRFWELWAGSLLAYLQAFRLGFSDEMKLSLSNRLSLLSGFGGVLLLAGFTLIDKERLFPGAWALLPVLGACFLIASGPSAWFNRTILARRSLVAVGLISYPLYLWHWPLLSFARIMEEQTPSVSIRLGAVVLALLLSALTFWFIERPLRFGGKWNAKAIGLIALMAVVWSVGALTWRKEGLPFRDAQQLVGGNLLAFAWKDPEMNWQQACRDKMGDAEMEYCLQAIPEKPPTILLVGDSHANAAYPGLSKLFTLESENLLSLGKGGCPPLIGVHRYAETQYGCPNLMDATLERVLPDRLTRIVVIAERAVVYISGVRFGEIDGNDEVKIGLVTQPNLSDQAKIFEIGMRSTLEKLTQAGKQVVFFVDVPELGFDPKECVEGTRPLRITDKKKLKFPCAVSRHAFDERNAEYHALVTKVLADFPQVLRFDAWKPFCDEEWCWAMKDGKMLYRDDDHLSVAGSHFLADYFAKEMLVKVLAR